VLIPPPPRPNQGLVAGRLPTGVETPIHLPGGTLSITVAKELTGVLMRGPARIVFEATIDVARLLERQDIPA
jgi:hypothetical protein